jgi:AcrR family transcriptional regulator
MTRPLSGRGPVALDEIIAAALRLIRSHGLEKLTMRSVAKELGVTPMATYHHVANKAELVDLVHDAVSREWGPLVLGDDGWEEELRRYLLSRWEAYRRYPGLGAWRIGRPDLGTTPESYSVMVTFFLSAGFDEEAAIMAWSFAETCLLGRLTVDARLHGMSRQHREGGLRARSYVERGVDAVVAGIQATLSPTASNPTPPGRHGAR